MKRGALLAVFLFVSFSAFAEKIFFQDEKKTWNVGITVFSVPDNSPDAVYIRNSLPLFFVNQLSVCKTHRLADAEKSLLREKIVAEKIREEEEKLSSLKKEYDMAFFSHDSKKKEISDKIRKSERLIRTVKNFNPEKIEIRPEKDIFLVSANSKNEPLVMDFINIEQFSAENNLDYLIYGNARIFNNMIFVETKLYSSLEKKNLYVNAMTVEISTLFEALEKNVNDLITIILGSPWSKLSVVSDNKEADIYLDSSYIGTSAVRNYITTPGHHIIAVKGEGIAEKNLDVFLREKEENIINIETEYQEEKLLAINSIPQGADVYYDSLWSGKTPFLVNGLSGEIILRKEGYRDSRFFLDEVPGNFVELKLSPDIFSGDKYLETKRNSFYRNLSMFVLSVPVPFFMFAVLNDYSDAYNNSVSSAANPEETERLRKLTNFSYYGYYGSLFLTISLFINTIFHLNDYIKAADVLSAE